MLALFVALAFSLRAQAPNAEQIRRVTDQIAAITGLAVKRAVPCSTISRADWKRWVSDEIRHTVKPAEIRAEELALKKLGLIPRDFDLKQATIDLLGEQAAAVYDHRRKRMLFVEGASDGPLAEAILVHELSHAVADQNFDMHRFLDKGATTDEAQTARMAVVEGQAMWIMVESQLRALGQSLKSNPRYIESLLPGMGKLAADAYPVFSNAPLYLRETLVFPYTAGLVFQQAAFEKLGQAAFAELLRHPPVSTQQLIHPEKYFAGTRPTTPTLPPFERPRGYSRLTRGSLGELDFRILLEQYTSAEEARACAPHWRGATFDLLEDRRDGRAVLRWAAEWDSADSAAAFLRLYRRVLAGKWKDLSIETESETRLAGSGGGGAFVIVADGTTVSGLEGLQLIQSDLRRSDPRRIEHDRAERP